MQYVDSELNLPGMEASPVGRSGVDRASSSDARGPGFDPRPLHLKNTTSLPKPSGSSELGLWSLSCIGGDTGFRPKKAQILLEGILAIV